MMKRLLPAKSILLTALCFSVINPTAHAKTMYKWTDEKGKVSFSDQVPPTKVELKHEELDKNAQVIKVNEKAKTKAELEMEKRLIQLRKQQEQIVAKQKAHDKKLQSSFLNLDAMDANHKAKVQALNDQERDMRETIKKQEEELTAQQQDAASYEIKNTKIPAAVLDKIEDSQKKIAQTKQDIKQLQLKKASFEKEFTSDRARFASLAQAQKDNSSSAPDATNEKAVNQPGLFNCENAEQCEKAWPIAKEFVKTNSVAKINVDTDTLFMSEDPVSDTDLNLSISKMTLEGNNQQIFLDIRCTATATVKGLCSSSKADDIRSRFTDYLKTKLNAVAAPAPSAPKVATPSPAAK
jgi:hypothetical protein